MNFRKPVMSALIFASAVMFLVGGIQHSYAVDSKQIEWKTITASGVVLDYQPGDEETAVQLLPELVKIVDGLKTSTDLAQLEEETSKIENRKTECLNFIAVKIGLSAPGESMKKAFDSFLMCQKMGIAEIKDVSRFRLWERGTLMECLKSGMRVRGFAYDRAKDDLVRALSVSYNPNGISGMFLDDKKLPLVYQKGDSVSAATEKARTEIENFRRNAKQTILTGVIFHETAETGIVSDFGLRTPFRRWFCDGVAQWVAEVTTKEFIGQSAYEHIVELFDTKGYESQKAKVDLIGWRAAEWEESMPKCPGIVLVSAHYAFAVKEIRGLAERHGTDVIAKVISQLSKLEADNRDSAAILDAIHSAANEDMRATLSQYGKEAQDVFHGLCITGFKFNNIETGNQTPIELKAGDTIKLDGKHDIGIEFRYLVLDQPVEVRLEVSDVWHSGTKLGSKKKTRVSTTIGLTKSVGKFTPGAYTVRVLFNGKVFKEIPVTFVGTDNS